MNDNIFYIKSQLKKSHEILSYYIIQFKNLEKQQQYVLCVKFAYLVQLRILIHIDLHSNLIILVNLFGNKSI